MSSIEPDTATAIKLVRASIRHDLQGMTNILNAVDLSQVIPLIMSVSGVAVALGLQAHGGPAELDAFLAEREHRSGF